MPVIATKKKVKLHQIYSEKESEMFKNRKIKVLGMAVLLAAVAMFVIGPANMPASVQYSYFSRAIPPARASTILASGAQLHTYHLPWRSTSRENLWKLIPPKSTRPV